MTALVSSTARPLPLAMRRDLIVERQRWQGRDYWTIKDPLRLKYYRFEEEEFSVLSSLDSAASSDQIREQFERRFAPQRLSASQLQRLLAMLHRSNLLVSAAPGQGGQLLERDRHERQSRRWAAPASILCFRWRGFDPDRLLTSLDRNIGWVFSIPAATVACGLIITALLLVASEFDTFRARLPSFQGFFGPHNWWWLAITLSLTKILHEFGHGLACKRFGGQCHEMGVMLLALTPCLYCNVSDAWMIRSRWRRAAVGAAGMYFELLLAALCTFLWWFSEPGLLHHLCLNIMFVSSVSTLLLNANPLMRFDGYYILADLLEVPNLRQKAAALIQRPLVTWLLGLRLRPDPFLPTRHRWLFAAYGVASSIYGWLVSLSILWFLYRVLEPYGLKVLGQVLAAVMLFSLVVLPLVRLMRFVFEPARGEEVKTMRAALMISAIVAVIAGLMCVPLPYYVACALEIQPRAALSVYAEQAGELRAIHATAGTVQAGQTIAELDNADARLAVERLRSKRGDVAARIESIRQRAYTEDAAFLELAQTEEALAALDAQIKRLEEDLAKLVVRAPASGVLVPPAGRQADHDDQMRLVSWIGRPLDRANVGAFIETSTLLCRIAQPGQLEAILAIDQGELDFVHAGQPVKLLLASRPDKVFCGSINHLSQQKMELAPLRLTARAGGQLATQADNRGGQRPLSIVYQASVPIDAGDDQIAVGATGQACIHAGYQSLGRRLWRSACRTFHFEM